MLQLDFPSPFTPDDSKRAGRMMSAGRVKVTMTVESGEHYTVLLKSFADNRERQYDPEISKRWVESPLEYATHVFAEVPRPSSEWNDKIGTYYPRSGKWFDADDADPRRIDAAKLIANWLAGAFDTLPGTTFQEASECAAPGCGLELTDPISIKRGIGPTCFGKITGSQHQVKWAVRLKENSDTETSLADAPHDELEAFHLSQEDDGDSLLGHAEDLIDTHGAQGALEATYGSSAKKNVSTVHVDFRQGTVTTLANHDLAEVTVENFAELGITSAAENALFSLAMGLDESQLETLNEWVHDRLEKVRSIRRQIAAAARRAAEEKEKPVDRSFMER